MFRRLEASAHGAVRQPADYSISKQGPTAEAIASALDATNGNRKPAPQTAAGEDGRESQGRVHDVKIDGDSMVESKGGEFSPGKGPNLSVGNYVSQISENWQRGVDAFMTIARLCAEAGARLTITERGELLKQLPFGATAFSKFVQIGNDRRLNTPELRRLLPPHYTITYAVTLLTDQELQDAIAAKVIHPDMQRVELQRWRNSHRELPTKGEIAPNPKEAASDSAVASPPTVPTQDEAEQKAAGEIAELKADLAKNKGTVGNLEADYGDTGISITSPGTAPSRDQDIATDPPLSEDEQRQADELERVWVKCCPLVRQRHWAKYARASVSTTQAPTSSNIR
jgi:hypothetical protein